MAAFFGWIIKIALYAGAVWFMHTDSKNRDVSGILWDIAGIILCFFGFFGLGQWLIYPLFLIAYFLLRPKGELVYCTECFKKKLLDKPYCPHCFHIDESVLEDDEDETDEEDTEDEENNVEESACSCCSSNDVCSTEVKEEETPEVVEEKKDEVVSDAVSEKTEEIKTEDKENIEEKKDAAGEEPKNSLA